MGFNRKYNAIFKTIDNIAKIYKISKEKSKKKDGKK